MVLNVHVAVSELMMVKAKSEMGEREGEGDGK